MIFYFSGTGNSEWCAKQIAEKINDKAINILDVKENSYSFEKDQTVGFVFPVYAWGPPYAVIEFAKKITANGAFVFAVDTCAGNAGNSMKIFSKAIKLNSAYTVLMPSNYMIFGNVDDPQKAIIIIDKAKIRIENICKNINAKLEIFDLVKGKFKFIKTVVNSFFNRGALSAKPFCAKNSCNGCGLCEKICSAKIIKMEDDRPVWGEKCYQCLACINRCPKQAIEYGKTTIGKGRYYFPQAL